jgi:hypothetical protein
MFGMFAVRVIEEPEEPQPAEAAAVPCGHTAFSWHTAPGAGVPAGHTPFSWALPSERASDLSTPARQHQLSTPEREVNGLVGNVLR